MIDELEILRAWTPPGEAPPEDAAAPDAPASGCTPTSTAAGRRDAPGWRRAAR